jgi:hypothetical protein
MSKETIKVVEINTDPAKKSIKDLRKELMELKNQMANLEEGGDEFLEIANKAGNLKHQLDEINKVVGIAAYEFDDYAGKIGGVAAGLSGAFTAVNGALNLFGKESEAIDKAILKMQSLMAITQGLSTIPKAVKDLEDLRNSITATTGAAKLLKAALQPKVFLAITAAISALSVVFGKLAGNAKKLEEREKARAEAYKQAKFEERVELEKKYNNELERQLKLQERILDKRYGGDDERVLKDLIKYYNTEISKLDERLKDRYNDNLKLSLKAQLRQLEKDILGVEEGSQRYFEILVEIASLQDEISKVKPMSEEEIKRITDSLSLLNSKLDETKIKLEETQIINSVEQVKNPDVGLSNLSGKVVPLQIEPLPTETLEGMGERIGKVLADAEIKARNQRWKEEVENIENVGNEVFEQLKSSMGMFTDSSLGLTSGWIAGLDEFQLAFQQTMAIVKDEGTVSWTAYGNVASTALAGVGTMLNALSNEQDASNEEGFKQMKNLQIAATVMNMLSGIMSAWTSAMSPANAWMTVAGQIAMGTAMSAMIAGIGGAQIAKIKSQTMESANPNTNINAKSISSMIVPPVQYSNAVQGANTEGAIANQKVYVTESDIVDTIGKVSVQETENTY